LSDDPTRRIEQLERKCGCSPKRDWPNGCIRSVVLLLLVVAEASAATEVFVLGGAACSQPESGCQANDPERGMGLGSLGKMISGRHRRQPRERFHARQNSHLWRTRGRQGLMARDRPVLVDGTPVRTVFVRPRPVSHCRTDKCCAIAIVYLTPSRNRQCSRAYPHPRPR